MGTSIGGVIDYFVTGLVGPITAINPEALVVDNHPETNASAMVVIGHTAPGEGTAADGEAAFIYVGQQSVRESYVIPCYVEVTGPGPLQKPTRDACIDLFNAVVHFAHSDPTFGGLLLDGRVGLVSKLHLRQTQDAGDIGSGGTLRLARLGFEIHVENVYVP